jgi:D-alanyl-lipoteichoic acid acyltransferase DltB (MBOAT superfamily)
LERIVCGFFKVNVLAMLLHSIQENALDRISQPLPATTKLAFAILLAVVYPFFLYANFSGSIDIVIALARLMRVRLPKNFDRPFSASTFLDFWNRWHITLSTWLKSYVYNPLLLVLMRRIPIPALVPFLGVISFFATFFLSVSGMGEPQNLSSLESSGAGASQPTRCGKYGWPAGLGGKNTDDWLRMPSILPLAVA